MEQNAEQRAKLSTRTLAAEPPLDEEYSTLKMKNKLGAVGDVEEENQEERRGLGVWNQETSCRINRWVGVRGSESG